MIPRIIVFIFAILPASYFIPLIALVLYKTIHGFNISDYRTIIYFLWPIGGILGVIGLWIIGLIKKPPKVLTTIFLSLGIISVTYTFIILNISISYSNFIERPGFLLLFPPTIISVIYMFKMWFNNA